MAEVSIIIRTKNEERWVGHCFKAVFGQKFKDFEVILVDNRSTDRTVEIARRYPVKEVVEIDRFKPGWAINEGIRRSSGRYLVCLSAHCVPQNDDWLDKLLRNFSDPKVAGVYGRQLPLSYSEASDKRDLLITFGLDRRVQIKDYFFHNANSMFRRDLWEQTIFDEDATNIEDRIWGKAMIEAGYHLVYEPEAPVYHHHGIHQDNNSERARSVVSVMEAFDEQASKELPDFLRAENMLVAAIVPVLGEPRKVGSLDLLRATIQELQQSKFVKKIFLYSEKNSVADLAKEMSVEFLLRSEDFCSKDKTLENILVHTLSEIENRGFYPDAVLNVNYLYPFRPKEIFDLLIQDQQAKGLDTTFAGFTDYNNVWVATPQGGFTQVGEGFKGRDKKQPLYEALYGLGCVTASHVLHAGRLVGDRVGILPVTDRTYTLKLVDSDSKKLIEAILQHRARA